MGLFNALFNFFHTLKTEDLPRSPTALGGSFPVFALAVFQRVKQQAA